MEIRQFESAGQAAQAAADYVALAAQQAFDDQRRFTMALSGGRAPWAMISALADQMTGATWANTALFQVDERIVEMDSTDRNWQHMVSCLGAVPVATQPMPVELILGGITDAQACARYAAGLPSAFDLIHLGLGADGHTASLLPGDPVLDVCEPVATTGQYQGRRRMTLTYPVLNTARALVWLVTGAEKADALAKLIDADPTIPAGRVCQERAVVFTDVS
ncbi:MAG: 6-phosphogluconolactonase [Propionibacteriaceae bacterium]